VNFRRVALATAAATMAAAALAPSAHAWTRFSFATEGGAAAQVEVDAPMAHTRLEIARGAAVVAQSTTDSVSVVGLQAGDVARLYDGTALVASGTYDGLPEVSNVCVGHTAFSATRATSAEVVDAGAYWSFAGSIEWVDATWTADASAVVSLERPLALGDMVYVKTAASDGATEIRSSRGEPALSCWYDPPPERTPPSGPPPNQPTIAPPELTPTSAQMLQMVRGSLSASGSSLRARTTRSLARFSAVAIPFAFPEPGRVDLELVAKNKVIGTGAKTSAMNGKEILTVKLTTAGRALLKRSKKLRITLRATFTPSRAGARPQRASVKVTLTGSSSRA
jgi:hypothetical protein